MNKRLVIRGGQVVTPGGVIENGTVLVEQGRIVGVVRAETPIWPDAEIYDAAGCLVFPGVVAPHTHILLDTGIYRTADNWEIGTRTAACGGVTTVIDFATQFPGMTFEQALETRRKEAESALIDYSFHMMITDLPRDPVEARRWLEALRDRGVSSIKLYTTYRPNYYADDALLLHTLRALPDNMLTMVHCENDAIVTDATKRLVEAGNTSWAYHGQARPPEAEVEAIRRVMYLAKIAEKPVYIVHCSTADSVRQVERAHRSGNWPPVYCETCPQYFVLDDSRYTAPNAEQFILQPPLRPADWQVDLIKAAPTLSAVSTDHCDYTLAQKQEYREFTRTPGGLPGLETAFALTYTYGVHKPEQPLPLTELARLMSTEPAKLFGLYPRKGAIVPGGDADLLIYDPREAYTIKAEDMHTIGGYTSYAGMTVQGRIQSVMSRGEWLVKDGAWQAPTVGRGQFLKGAPFVPLGQGE